mmetsp:Transcript_19725/g.19832  ORF Transcript_19725/g.19832 Transcript_19725/m.19832 type:complete len:154 (+) Transcript_19725:186-647(+)
MQSLKASELSKLLVGKWKMHLDSRDIKSEFVFNSSSNSLINIENATEETAEPDTIFLNWKYEYSSSELLIHVIPESDMYATLRAVSNNDFQYGNYNGEILCLTMYFHSTKQSILTSYTILNNDILGVCIIEHLKDENNEMISTVKVGHMHRIL